jgi:lysophospholipase L1-like esterase
MIVRPSDPRLSWEGAVSLEHRDGGMHVWRLPVEKLPLFYEGLVFAASSPAGVRIRFRTDSTSVGGDIGRYDEPGKIDLEVDGRIVDAIQLSDRDRFLFSGLDPSMKTIELWLPQRRPFDISAIKVDDDAVVEPDSDPRPKWVVYGSSITHCGQADSPSQTWPGIVARNRGFNLTCLGYGNECRLDPHVGLMIRDLPADYICTAIGSNLIGGSMNLRTFRIAVMGFVRIIREKHADTPFVVMSPTIIPRHESALNVVGMSLEIMRKELREAVEILRGYGDTNLHYADGLKVFGRDEEHLLTDGVHPNADGYRAMGRNFTERFAERYYTPKGL